MLVMSRACVSSNRVCDSGVVRDSEARM